MKNPVLWKQLPTN